MSPAKVEIRGDPEGPVVIRVLGHACRLGTARVVSPEIDLGGPLTKSSPIRMTRQPTIRDGGLVDSGVEANIQTWRQGPEKE